GSRVRQRHDRSPRGTLAACGSHPILEGRAVEAQPWRGAPRSSCCGDGCPCQLRQQDEGQVAWHDCDPPHGATAIRTDGEVSSGERAIAWGVIIGRLADGTRETGFEQPTTESEAVTAGAIGEKTVVAGASGAVRQSVQ